MVGNLLLRGLAAGFIAGLLAFGFARIFGEPQIDRAIAFEEQVSHAHTGHGTGEAPEAELVSRETQDGLGLFTGVVIYSTAIGGLFSLLFAFVYGRAGRLGARATSALLASACFIALVLVPSLKYPANPPAVGDAETIGLRTQLFLAMLIVSAAAMALSVLLARRLAVYHGAWNGTLLAAAAFIAIIAVAQYALPAIGEVPEGFSATLLWRFRMASLGLHAVLWTALGIVFGYMSERSLAGQSGGRLPAGAYWG
jgi:hypothetical protein